MIFVIRNRLKELINQKGYGEVPYRKLAMDIGIDHVSLWKMINGKPFNPSTNTLDKLCKFFKCKVGDILEYKR